MNRVSFMSALGWTLVAAAALSICVAGCGGDDDSDDDPSDGDHGSDEEGAVATPSGAKCPSDSMLTYDNFGKEFMGKYCVRCHSSKLEGDARNDAPEGHDFDMYEGIIGVAEHIDQNAAAGPDSVNTTMPPTSPKPTEEEREKLGEWLACEIEMLEE